AFARLYNDPFACFLDRLVGIDSSSFFLFRPPKVLWFSPTQKSRKWRYIGDVENAARAAFRCASGVQTGFEVNYNPALAGVPITPLAFQTARISMAVGLCCTELANSGIMPPMLARARKSCA